MAATSGAPAALADALDDLVARFVVNVPTEELQAFERICFQIEQAWWFYEDHYRERDASLPKLNLREFTLAVFQHVPMLQRFVGRFDIVFQRFLDYKHSVPVCGAILLSPAMDKCVLVKGWSAKAGWSFPRGKINQQEEMHKCATREVYEEVGYDIGPLLKQDVFLEHVEHEHPIRLYIIPNVPETTAFQTLTRKEISRIEWFDVASLPTSRDNDGSKFWTVTPFVNENLPSKLQRWVKEHQPGRSARNARGSTAKGSAAPTPAPAPAPTSTSTPTPTPTPTSTPGGGASRSDGSRPGVSLIWPPFPSVVDIGRSLLDFRLDRAALLAAFSSGGSPTMVAEPVV